MSVVTAQEVVVGPFRFAPKVFERRFLPLAILLIAMAFRFVALYDAPPGWRDDELIEWDMDLRIRDGWRPLYITEAEGHEPLYHYLHAVTIALFGENIVGYKWLSMAFGVLTVALTFALARRLFGTNVALAASALLAVSFWPIMYSRFGLRHVGLLPWMLGVYGVAVDMKIGARRRLLPAIAGSVCLAAGLMTYFAGRVVPVVVLAFALYLFVFHRTAAKRAWLTFLIIPAIGAVLALPMFLEINRLLPGGEQRLEVAGPQLTELRKGNLQPAIETTIGTLGMFTFRGDPEALYNVEGRPVFDGLTGVFFYAGLTVALWRWRRIEYAFALIAFGLGIAPAFISNPPASFSHTLAAMPLVYVLLGLGVVEAASWTARQFKKGQGGSGVTLPVHLVTLSLTMLNVVLTTRDYFGAWASDSYVRFLYHAPIREIAQWLDESPAVKNIAVSTHPNYFRLDPLSLSLDLKRADVTARWFDSRSALVRSGDRAIIAGTTLDEMGAHVPAGPGCCAAWSLLHATDGFEIWEQHAGPPAYYWSDLDEPVSFAGRLTLTRTFLWPKGIMIEAGSAPPSDEVWLDLVWRVEQSDLPAALNIFAHIVDAEGNIVSQYDGVGVYLPSLLPDDRFIQFIRLPKPIETADDGLAVRIGVYDATTHTRLLLPDGREFVTVEIP